MGPTLAWSGRAPIASPTRPSSGSVSTSGSTWLALPLGRATPHATASHPRCARSTVAGSFGGRAIGRAPPRAVGLPARRALDGRGLVRWTGERARLTPRGRILANEVFVQLLS